MRRPASTSVRGVYIERCACVILVCMSDDDNRDDFDAATQPIADAFNAQLDATDADVAAAIAEGMQLPIRMPADVRAAEDQLRLDSYTTTRQMPPMTLRSAPVPSSFDLLSAMRDAHPLPPFDLASSTRVMEQLYPQSMSIVDRVRARVGNMRALPITRMRDGLFVKTVDAIDYWFHHAAGIRSPELKQRMHAMARLSVSPPTDERRQVVTDFLEEIGVDVEAIGLREREPSPEETHDAFLKRMQVRRTTHLPLWVVLLAIEEVYLAVCADVQAIVADW